MRQWYCIVGSLRYGPVAQEQLVAWMSQGRVKSADLVWAAGMPNWAPAGSIGELAPGRPGILPIVSPLERHRGGAILALGIISIVVFCLIDIICGIIGWVMANRDLAEIKAGRMDPSGQSLTSAGRICCIIGVILGCLYAVAVLVWLVLWFSITAVHVPYQ